jgi:hypothetical protein
MKNKSMIGLRLVNILLIFGTTVALLVSTSSSQMISASVEGGAPGPNNSNSNQGAESANKCTVYQCIYYQCIGQSCLAGPEQSQGGSQGTAPGSSSGGASSNPNQQAIDHINQAQSSLQNGDTEGAQKQLDSARTALGCTPHWPDPC